MPRVLAKIAVAFGKHPDVDMLVGTYFVVDADSHYICHRRPVSPWRWTSQAACELIVSTGQAHLLVTESGLIRDSVHYQICCFSEIL